MKLPQRKGNSKEVVLVLDNIRSRFNVGSIFRTADGAGVSKIYLCGITPVPPHPKISKVALGAENYLCWEKRAFTWRLLEELKKNNYYLIALEQGAGAKNIFSFQPPFPVSKVALVVGSETRGLSEAILKRTDIQLEIPMRGRKKSLNVAVALGIAVYYLTFAVFGV